jgi:hypothetical protein
MKAVEGHALGDHRLDLGSHKPTSRSLRVRSVQVRRGVASSMVHRGRLLSPALVVKLSVRNLCDAERGPRLSGRKDAPTGMANRCGHQAEYRHRHGGGGARSLDRPPGSQPTSSGQWRGDSWPISGWSPSPQRSRRATYAVVRTSSLSRLYQALHCTQRLRSVGSRLPGMASGRRQKVPVTQRVMNGT